MSNSRFVIITAVLGALGCENKLKIRTVKSEPVTKVSYKPGSVVEVNSDDAASYPLVLADPSTICSDITFYNADGELVNGARSCIAVGSESTLKPEYIKEGVTIGGVTGTLLATGPANCSSNGEIGCVTTATYKAADLTNLNAANIKAGVTIAGQVGDYPSATYPLPSASGIADLDSATFNAKIKSATAFEYWTSNGTYQTGAGDADITAGNIVTGITVFGATGNVPAAQCTAATQGACVTDAACRWTGAACEVSPWNIRTGVTIAGKTGSIKTNCRNQANSARYNTDAMPPGNAATTGGSTVDWWDTIDNWNNNIDALPTEQPAGWTSDHACSKEIWSDVTADGACDEADDDCMMRDNITGLLWSESDPVTGVAAADSTKDWSTAVAQCDGLSYGGRTDWRIPTQLELMQGLQHGIRTLAYKGGGTIRPSGDSLDNNNMFIADPDLWFWTATALSDFPNYAFVVDLADGYAPWQLKTTNTIRVICIAP